MLALSTSQFIFVVLSLAIMSIKAFVFTRCPSSASAIVGSFAGDMARSNHYLYSNIRLLRKGRKGGISLIGKATSSDSRSAIDNIISNVMGASSSKLKVLKYPHPKLRAENAIIDNFDEELKLIAKDMLSIMYKDDGVGLAAPQVGVNKRLMVFNEEGDITKPQLEMVLANPVIVAKSEGMAVREEGCLSFPMINGKVSRHEWIEIEYQNISGEKVTKRLEGFPARIFQHEYDHLDKVLFIDRFESDDKALNKKRLEKYVKKYGADAAP